MKRLRALPKPAASIPRWLRPRLRRSQVIELALLHLQNLDAISKGAGNEDLLWDWVGAVLTWSRTADKLGKGVPEMCEQIDLVRAVIDRYRATGRIVLTGPEYQQAKLGVEVMNVLAQDTDHHTAEEAAEWSQRRLDAMAADAQGLATHTKPTSKGGHLV